MIVLKMALQQFVCRFTLMTLLLCSGCHPAVNDNSTVVENVSPGDSPWLVYFYPDFRCEGSLITTEWVLTDSSCLKPSDINTTSAFVGLIDRASTPAGNVAFFRSIVCNTENKNGTTSGICLLKLQRPIRLSNDTQLISLASNMSTFYDGISSWVSVNDFISERLNVSTQREVKASILGNNQCNCKQNQSNVTEKEMCATIGGSYPCQVIPGSPLVIREQSQWVLAGVAISTSASCGDPGVFSRVSWYQDWIREVITGTEPTFVTVSSTGSDPDVNFICSTEVFPTTTTTTIGLTTTTTTTPSAPPIVDPTGMGTRSYGTTTTGMTPLTPTTPDDSIFSGGENLIHFTHFFSLSALVLFLHVLVGDSEI
ncbi:chymotrypsin-like protease CTRL-1 [Oryzias latipes]|uniref:Peptidase S1 domain-containing protein n=1 Tax=Oryzias latipes TaxID=8090 RepID=A0A3B3IM34_ORYLA|nr:chymotrypsin-like protease CTRL-1 [Oryzias latipes]